MISAKVQCRGT